MSWRDFEDVDDLRLIVGVGASAGGLQALELFFGALTPPTGCAFVVVQHLSPDHPSLMAELLGRRTALPVREAVDGAVLAADSVTLLPPGHSISVSDGRLHLTPRQQRPGGHWPIDDFLESLAAAAGEHAVAVILTGTGSDGSRGVSAVRDHGGLVFAEDPATAAFDGMPRAAMATGAVSLVGTPSALAQRLADLGQGPLIDESEQRDENDFERIFAALQSQTGIDFWHYKRPTVERRVARRAAIVGGLSLEEYASMITASSEERIALSRELMIGVTGFFRDPAAWESLAELVLAPAVADPHRLEFRAWVAGCSTGQEAYTLAMLLIEEQERQGRRIRAKIFATDVSPAALAKAAHAEFSPADLESLTPERRARFFSRDGEVYVAAPELRRMILFTTHDLTTSPPFTRLDLISCRNVLIYLDQQLQRRVLGAFRFGLRTGGWLLLSPSENPPQDAQFEPVDTKSRLFRATGERPRSTWLLDRASATAPPLAHPSVIGERSHEDEVARSVRLAGTLLLERFTPPAVLVDESFRIHHVFGSVNDYLRIPPGSIELNLLDMTSPSIAAALGPGLGRALATGESWTFRPLAGFSSDDEVSLQIVPLAAEGSSASSVALVCFHTIHADHGSSRTVDLDRDASLHLAELSAELQRSQASRQELIEELSAANEELQATNEELQATNEELQATNEELQATNEELHTVNDEHEQQIQLLKEVQADLDSLMTATDIGSVFLDEQLTIRRFTPSVTEFLPLLDRDIGRKFTDLAVALDPQFVADVEAILNGAELRERSLDTVHGPVLLRILPYHVRHTGGVVITITDVTAVRRSYELALRVLDALPAQVAFVGMDGTIRMVNASWSRVTQDSGSDPSATGVGANYFEACAKDPDGATINEGVRKVLAGELSEFRCEYPCDTPDDARWFAMRASPAGAGEAVLVHFDVTEQKRAEELLRNLATRDHLTNVMNRRGLDARLSAEVHQWHRLGVPCSAVMLDCDDFKRINDSIGHTGGDVVLTAVARRIDSVLRPTDTTARIGGDEFLVLLPGTTIVEAGVIAERIRLAVGAEPVAASFGDIGLTVSIAVVAIDGDVHTLEQLLDRCRFALRRSKDEGKNRVTFGTSLMAAGRRRDTAVASAITVSELEETFAVAAQPIVRFGTSREIAGFELLTRSTSAPYTPPSTLFRAAMEDGVLATVDERCLRRGLAAASALPDRSSCHLNVFPSTLLHLTSEVIESLFAAQRGIELCVELSEQQILSDPASLLPRREELRALGVRFAVDDVGFGRTSLENLIVLEPDIVKIDIAYVKGVSASVERQRWLSRLVEIAEALKATTIAEGVETESDALMLEDLGVEFGQGYFFGRPTLLPLEPVLV